MPATLAGTNCGRMSDASGLLLAALLVYTDWTFNTANIHSMKFEVRHSRRPVFRLGS